MASLSSVSYNDPDSGVPQQVMGHSIYEDSGTTQSASSAVVSFLANQFGKKHDDLKTMLDSSKDSQKLDAMKRIVGMMASGKDVSELFPAVVKNVVSKNIEIKKLVYVYLVRYAEEQQDLALLSIATFQRGLKDPNQLIRASALRVLSSIRVPVIVPIMMLSLKEAVTDMSPYVRKTAANAIPKLYCLDAEQKDALVEIIEKLLQDKTTLVAGSTVIAFEEVCPERIDLIHKNYRKLCNMLIDIDEWGQVAVINMLVRYSRTQFLDPNKNVQVGNPETQQFYPSSESENSDESDNEDAEKPKAYVMDPDHRLLLRSCQPLLQSRNAAVIMAIAKVYHHLAPASEVGIVVKALVRLLRSHREVQTIVLSNIVTISLQRKGLFDSYLKSFFVHAGDPTHIKKLKLEILTNLATESNIPTILREFQTYVASSDKEFVASTIQSIGRCASNIPEVTDTCLAGLIRMLSNHDEHVVSESIIVVKKLLQMRQKDHSDVIVHMAKLLEKVHVPMARASILWLIGEYSDRIPKISPDVLRQMAKTFASEEDIVKLQILNLGAKLYVTNSKQTRSLCQYVIQLAKYDQNYDIRDRARFLKFMLFPADRAEGTNNLKKKAKKVFLVEKPAPVLQSLFKDRGEYQLGSLSHMIDAKANGYQELPDFPDEQPDPTVRNVEMQPVWGNQFLLTKEKDDDKDKSFYSDENEDDDDESEEDSDEETDSDDESSEEETNTKNEEENNDDDEESSEEDDSEDESEFEELSGSEDESSMPAVKAKKEDEESDEDVSDEEEEEEEDDDDETSSEDESDQEMQVTTNKTVSSVPHKSSYDQLLDLDDDSSSSVPAINGNTPVLTPSLVSDMETLSMEPSNYSNYSRQISTASLKSYELLNKINGKGLTAEYRFTRGPCIYSRTMVGIEIDFKNQSNKEIKHLHVGKKKLASGSQMQEFAEIGSLPAGQQQVVSIGIDFKDTMQPVTFELCTEVDTFSVTIKVPVGELVKPANLTENQFESEQGQLTGMTESRLECKLNSTFDHKVLCSKVLQITNLQQVPSPPSDVNILRFAGSLISSTLPVLLTLKGHSQDCTIVVNCEKISIASLLAKEIKNGI